MSKATKQPLWRAAAGALALASLAACGGSAGESSDEVATRQRDEAAALQKALQTARDATSARVRGERAAN